MLGTEFKTEPAVTDCAIAKTLDASLKELKRHGWRTGSYGDVREAMDEGWQPFAVVQHRRTREVWLRRPFPWPNYEEVGPK